MTTIQDSLDREFAPGWQPAPGDKIVGVITEMSERDGTYGRYPVLTLRTADGDETAVHAFHEVLQTELAKAAPKVGDEIGIKYTGKHEERGYHMYRVRRAGDETHAVNWDRYGAEARLPDDGRSEDERDADNNIPF